VHRAPVFAHAERVVLDIVVEHPDAAELCALLEARHAVACTAQLPHGGDAGRAAADHRLHPAGVRGLSLMCAEGLSISDVLDSPANLKQACALFPIA
jgi:hypothetical protein